MLQFDIVLQKQNLGAHQDVHPAMYMPSHGEFLVEALARAGLKPGLIFGLDDFAHGADLLNQSTAELLIVCGADQHLSEAFESGWKQLRRRYQRTVLIVSEPIYSPLAYYLDAGRNAVVQHERFLERVQPDLVLYLSQIDVIAARARHGSGFACELYSLADPELLREPVLDWPAKDPVLLYLGKPQAWLWARRPPGAMTREQQLDFFRRQTRQPFAWSERSFSFRECYGVVNQFRFQLQPRSGYAFHTARVVQSAIAGCIPVILLHRDEVPLLQAEAPFARPGYNLIVGLEGDFDSLLDQMQDEAHCRKIQSQLGELLAAGTITQGAQRIADWLRGQLEPGTEQTYSGH
ncbi:MAG: hypothetical protein CVV27_09555 [Candidatus Melainabacteria bacterium HGW-Melainabacteria-1]|nr:MAG: hypothetical protein CVV27_09555 [Candidatus Melainabacteria bacterium HGW-Melainabacteria-1]